MKRYMFDGQLVKNYVKDFETDKAESFEGANPRYYLMNAYDFKTWFKINGLSELYNYVSNNIEYNSTEIDQIRSKLLQELELLLKTDKQKINAEEYIRQISITDENNKKYKLPNKDFESFSPLYATAFAIKIIDSSTPENIHQNLNNFFNDIAENYKKQTLRDISNTQVEINAINAKEYIDQTFKDINTKRENSLNYINETLSKELTIDKGKAEFLTSIIAQNTRVFTALNFPDDYIMADANPKVIYKKISEENKKDNNDIEVSFETAFTDIRDNKILGKFTSSIKIDSSKLNNYGEENNNHSFPIFGLSDQENLLNNITFTIECQDPSLYKQFEHTQFMQYIYKAKMIQNFVDELLNTIHPKPDQNLPEEVNQFVDNNIIEKKKQIKTLLNNYKGQSFMEKAIESFVEWINEFMSSFGFKSNKSHVKELRDIVHKAKETFEKDLTPESIQKLNVLEEDLAKMVSSDRNRGDNGRVGP
ncbi:MAG: hypothetical protein J0H68_08410 [Sphingobacteriia bacterium]|nr:hypothetical protein [Sphingobacteriia bacterium]